MGCWMIFQLLKIPWLCRFGKLQAPSCPAPTSPEHPSSQYLFLHFCPQTNLSLSHSLRSILTYFLPDVPPRIKAPLDPLVRSPPLSCSLQTQRHLETQLETQRHSSFLQVDSTQNLLFICQSCQQTPCYPLPGFLGAEQSQPHQPSGASPSGQGS